jgi:hypothetical protein
LYGRVIIPESQRFSVVMLDNNKNEMIRFGDYGNGDETSSGGNILFAYPEYVWGVNRSVYVMDDCVKRIKLNYPVEWSRNQGLVTSLRAPSGAAVAEAITVYPQPASAGAALRITLGGSGPVEMGIYAPDGRLVRSFKTGAVNAGSHVFRWDGLSGQGERIGSGVYVVRMKLGNRILGRNMLVIR